MIDLNKNLKPTREHTGFEISLRGTVNGTRERIRKLQVELKHHEEFLKNAQDMCEHDFRGQDDEHPHGTPRETFVCTICLKEEIR